MKMSCHACIFVLSVFNPLYAACPLTEDMPCYQAPAQTAQDDKRRLSAGFFSIRGAKPVIRIRGNRGGGLTRGFSHQFSKSLNMPCGRSAAFPKKFKCAAALESKAETDTKTVVFPKNQRGAVEIIEHRTLIPPDIAPLAPEQVGLSFNNQPTLYWFLSRDWPGKLVFTLSRPGVPKADLQTTLEKDGGFQAGIHGLSLADYHVNLQEGVEYEWFISISADPEQPAGDIVAGGALLHQAQTASSDVKTLARQGAWYDALDLLSRRIEAEQAVELPRRQRAALFRQVNLPEAAEYEEERAGL